MEPGRVCKKWRRFKNNHQRKIKVLHPIPIEVIGDGVKDSSVEHRVQLRDMQNHLISNMPEHLKLPFMKMINGKDKEVSRKEKQKIREYVSRIIE